MLEEVRILVQIHVLEQVPLMVISMYKRCILYTLVRLIFWIWVICLECGRRFSFLKHVKIFGADALCWSYLSYYWPNFTKHAYMVFLITYTPDRLECRIWTICCRCWTKLRCIDWCLLLPWYSKGFLVLSQAILDVWCIFWYWRTWQALMPNWAVVLDFVGGKGVFGAC